LKLFIKNDITPDRTGVNPGKLFLGFCFSSFARPLGEMAALPNPEIFFALRLGVGYHKRTADRTAERMLNLAGTDTAVYTGTAFQGRRGR
jgi:hypothetical protein